MQRASTTKQATLENDRSETITKALLRCGVVASPLYIIVGAFQVLTRAGFDVRYNMLSQMSLGDQGWIQVANFVVSGLLVFARRFAKLGQRGWATYSAFTGVVFLVAFLGTASGSGGVPFTLALWGALALAWVWLSALSAKLID